MRIKLGATLLMAVALTGFYACGGSTSADTESAAETTTTTTAAAESAAPSDDGKGVGRFKEVQIGALDDAMAANGHKIFEAKCAACHKPTTDRLVGPGLKGVTERRKPEWILNMITNPQEMLQQDPTAKELLATYLTQMTFQDVSDEQAREILEYFRKNDTEK